MLKHYNGKFKIRESLYGAIKSDIEKLIEQKTEAFVGDCIATYKSNPGYKDYRVAFSFDILRAAGSNANTCYITKCYNNDLNDDHITRVMLHMLKPLFEKY